MIEVEIEDEAWAAALPDAQTLVIRAAGAAISSPPLRGRGQGEGGVSGTKDFPGASYPAFPSQSDVTILLTDDETVKDLNARFRAQDTPTNVLSFPAAFTAAPHLGDIMLAYGVCSREATAQTKPLAHHVMHLTAHGVLHLLGYDHETDADAEVMEALEREILAGLGVPDPYAPTPASHEIDRP